MRNVASGINHLERTKIKSSEVVLGPFVSASSSLMTLA